MTVVSGRLYCLAHMIEVHHAELAPAAITEILEALSRRCGARLDLEDFPLPAPSWRSASARPRRSVDWKRLAAVEVEATNDDEAELLYRLGCDYAQLVLRSGKDVEVGQAVDDERKS